MMIKKATLKELTNCDEKINQYYEIIAKNNKLDLNQKLDFFYILELWKENIIKKREVLLKKEKYNNGRL